MLWPYTEEYILYAVNNIMGLYMMFRIVSFECWAIYYYYCIYP